MNKDKPVSICVIEDNVQMAEMIRDFLATKFPTAVISVYDTGERALAETTEEPGVILLDYNLDTNERSALNGIQVLMQFKKKFSSPVVFLTAQERPDIAANIIKYGAADYVVKDQQSFGKLERSIARLIEKKPGRERKTEKKFLLIVVLIALAILMLYLVNG